MKSWHVHQAKQILRQSSVLRVLKIPLAIFLAITAILGAAEQSLPVPDLRFYSLIGLGKFSLQALLTVYGLALATCCFAVVSELLVRWVILTKRRSRQLRDEIRRDADLLKDHVGIVEALTHLRSAASTSRSSAIDRLKREILNVAEIAGAPRWHHVDTEGMYVASYHNPSEVPFSSSWQQLGRIDYWLDYLKVVDAHLRRDIATRRRDAAKGRKVENERRQNAFRDDTSALGLI